MGFIPAKLATRRGGLKPAVRGGGKTKSPGGCDTSGANCGSGRSPRALPHRHTLGRSRFRGRCASRRHSPRHADVSVSWRDRPDRCRSESSSEASSPSSDPSCRKVRAGRGADTPAKDVASAPWPRGRRRGLAGRWPRVTGLTSCLSGCVSRLQGGDAVFRHRPRRRWTDFAGSVRSPPSSLPCAPFPRVGNGPSGGVVPPGEALAFWSAQ